MAKIKQLLRRATTPVSQNEDLARSEFILNVLLIASISLTCVAITVNLIKGFVMIEIAVSAIVMLIPLSFFLFLYWISRKGYARPASFILIATISLIAGFMEYKWGVDIPMEILSQAMVIIMAGILISTRAAFIATFIISTVIALIAYFQSVHIIEANRYWAAEAWGIADVIVASVIFFIIATISWLSNREIEKSLARARRSEAELKKERDSLEITVEERTKQLKESQAEKMGQLYRFAEFGRLSSGLFLDLINPLNAVAVNVERLKGSAQTDSKISSEAGSYIDRAIKSAKKLQDLVDAVRKQLTREENQTYFSLNEEIEYVIEVLSHKAYQAGVAVNFLAQKDIRLLGDAVKFNQVVLNLVANAIDAYPQVVKGNENDRTVSIDLRQEGDKVILSITDNGVGIAPENLAQIFEPFFTTKKDGQGIGLGLSMTQRIIEKDFGGGISVVSRVGKGSVFTVQLTK